MAYGNRSLWKKIVYSPLGMIVATVLLFFLVRAAWNIHLKAAAADKRLTQAEQQLAQLQQQQASLSASIAYLSTPEGIEATLREKYHAVEQGESVAVILAAPSSTDPTSVTSATDASSTQQIGQVETSWWKNILHFVGL